MEEPSYHIHLVEDEAHLASVLQAYMEKEGWEVTVSETAEQALEHLNTGIHLWVLDIMLPGMSGYDLIKKIKQNNREIPVIFTSARDEDLDKIVGLEMGSDDYLTKPFLPKELIIRAKKLLHRVYSQDIKPQVFQVTDYTIDISRRRVSNRSDESIELTIKEFDLLLYLIENLNVAKSRDNILRQVWGDDYVGSTRAVDDVVRRIRKKMPRLNLDTVYGEGYRVVS
ncbi:response regulator transcription factor [Tuberibacillus sp. Marseille-P3662]|uniref:response regulator transcription factor n=1 Tax=Tuberibacillus sp. Marseille-P3662 TaxID=1965358 RepID=UPI000A1CB06A|nr:response regulator transcription factor [Tuberibacillus sp. Marseille-P3662]